MQLAVRKVSFKSRNASSSAREAESSKRVAKKMSLTAPGEAPIFHFNLTVLRCGVPGTLVGVGTRPLLWW